MTKWRNLFHQLKIYFCAEFIVSCISVNEHATFLGTVIFDGSSNKILHFLKKKSSLHIFTPKELITVLGLLLDAS